MTPERKAEIHEIIYGESEAAFEINAYDVACELLAEVDRLEGEIARYREEPSEEVVERAADAISAEIPSGINEDNVLKPRIMKWAKAAIEAYRSAVND